MRRPQDKWRDLHARRRATRPPPASPTARLRPSLRQWSRIRDDSLCPCVSPGPFAFGKPGARGERHKREVTNGQESRAECPASRGVGRCQKLRSASPPSPSDAFGAFPWRGGLPRPQLVQRIHSSPARGRCQAQPGGGGGQRSGPALSRRSSAIFMTSRTTPSRFDSTSLAE